MRRVVADEHHRASLHFPSTCALPNETFAFLRLLSLTKRLLTPHREARTVKQVPRCRAESFYLAPSTYRRFDEWAVFTKLDGEWIRVTHRRDVEQLSENPDWDQLCYVTYAKKNSDIDIELRIAKDPDAVELWRLDSRLVNGKRSGVEHNLFAVAKRGSRRAGGTRAAVGEILGVNPAAKAVVRWFEEDAIHPTVEASALRLLHGASRVLDDSGMQSLVAALRSVPAPVPFPQFDPSHLDLRFLERYPQQRRVTLLADLWRSHVADHIADAIRVASEVEERGASAAIKARAFCEHIAISAPDAVADLIASGRIELSDTLLQPGVVAILLASPRTAHHAAFHPVVSDPAFAIAALQNKKVLTGEVLNLPRNGLSPDTARAVLDELQRSDLLKHTHDSLQLRNVLSLAIAAAQTLPDAGPVLVKAYSNWTKNPAACQMYSADELTHLFRDRNITLDRLSAEQLHKAHLEHARMLERTTKKELPLFLSTGVLQLLENLAYAPSGIRSHAARLLDEVGLTHRTPAGERCTEYERLTRHDVSASDLRELLADTPADVSSAIRHITELVTTRICLHAPNTERAAEYEPVVVDALTRDTHAHSRRADWQHALARTAAAQVIAKVEELNRAHSGEITLAELGEHSFSSPSWRIVTERAVGIPREVRQALIETFSDADYALVGHILHQDCDIVSKAQRSTLSEDVHTRALLAQRDDVPWDEKPRRFSDLPTADHAPWNDVPPVADALDGLKIRLDEMPYRVSVIRGIEQLQANAAPNRMGNCTATHASSLRRGSEILLALDRGNGPEINVSLHQQTSGDTGPSWYVSEVKAAHNKPVHPRLVEVIKAAVLDVTAAKA